jgi:hypothetical protein
MFLTQPGNRFTANVELTNPNGYDVGTVTGWGRLLTQVGTEIWSSSLTVSGLSAGAKGSAEADIAAPSPVALGDYTFEFHLKWFGQESVYRTTMRVGATATAGELDGYFTGGEALAFDLSVDGTPNAVTARVELPESGYVKEWTNVAVGTGAAMSVIGSIYSIA